MQATPASFLVLELGEPGVSLWSYHCWDPGSKRGVFMEGDGGGPTWGGEGDGAVPAGPHGEDHTAGCICPGPSKKQLEQSIRTLGGCFNEGTYKAWA